MSDEPHTRFRHLPVLQGILPFNASRLPAEVLAGATFACLAIPEVMGYTKIAGTPVVTGLYTILIPMALFALLGSSRHLVVGADSATAAITASALAALSVTGPTEYMALASLLALMAGALLILARLVGLGFLADFLSRTVLVGFLTGVGIQVACGEVPGLFGIATEGHGTFEKLASGLQNADQINWPTFAIAVAVLALVVGSRRISAKIPGPLIAVVGVIALSWSLDLDAKGIALLGAVPGGLPTFSIPNVDWSLSLLAQLLPTALSIFVVILAQSAATSRAYAQRYNDRFSENTDLIGLGVANIGAGLTGTFVVNGSPTKTEMVAGAGGSSQIAQLTTAVIVLVVILFLTGPLALLPNVVLSAVVFLIGLKLIDIGGLANIYRKARAEFWIAIATAAIVVIIGVEQGIIAAMVLSLIDHTRKGYRPKTSTIVRDSGGEWIAKPAGQAAEYAPGLVIYRFSHGMYYANANRLQDDIETILKNAETPVRWFCFDASAIDEVDFTAGFVLRSAFEELVGKGVKIAFLFVDPEVRAELDRLGVTDIIGEQAFFTNGHELRKAYDA